MLKNLALFIILALFLASGTGLSMNPVHPAMAEGFSDLQTEDASTLEPVRPEEPTQPPTQRDETPSDSQPSQTAEPEPTEAPEEQSTPEPTQDATEEAAIVEPTIHPSEDRDTPTENPIQVPSETEEAPTQEPTAMPSETPAAPEDVGAYQVSPIEAMYMMGSHVPLTFAISPPDAPFYEVEGVECSYADSVVTIGAEALERLGGGEHTLAFIFDDGARVEVPLVIHDAKVAAKGLMASLIIGGKYWTYELSQDIRNDSQHWSWTAATATLTLDGYNGGAIYATGEQALTVATTEGSMNTITSLDASALYAENYLILKGSGTLNVLGNGGGAVVSNETISIESGTVRASGKENAFRSVTNDIRVSGGNVVAKQSGLRGGGFSSSNGTRVSGGSVTVEGAATAFGSLNVSGGTVMIRDCEVGVSGGFSASGGKTTFEDITGSAALSGQAMRFTDCVLNILACGEYGLSAAGGLTIGKGANFKIEAGKVALYAPGPTGTIRIEKGANLDLSGGEGALMGGKVFVNGKAYTGTYNRIVIQNGVIVRKENAMQCLIAGGRSYGAFSLSDDLTGEDWTWSASSRTLTLNGYDGGAVSAIGSPITLSLAGENKIDGDLTVSGAVVTGSGSLTASRIVGKADLEINSGTVKATRIALGGGFTLSGGAAILSGDDADPAMGCGNFNLSGGELTLVGAGALKPTGIRTSGSASIRGGSATVNGFGDFLQASGNVAITGGSIMIAGDTVAGIISSQAIKATGGSVSIKTFHSAMTAKGIEIGGKASIHLESATLTAFIAKTVKIAGKLYAPRYPGVIIEGGKLVEGYKLLPDLVVEGKQFSMKELNTGNRSGDGWLWSAKKNTLTLAGYRGKGIWINRNITVTLAQGTSNSGSADYAGGEAAIYSTEDLTLTGSGRFSGGLYGEGRLKITRNPLIFASAIHFRQGISIFGGRMEVSGNLEADDGDVLIENARVTVGRLRGVRVYLRKSSLSTTEKGSSGNPDLMAERALTISSSIVFCTQFGASGGKISLSGSPVFRRESSGGGEVFTLAQSVTITRDMTVSPRKNCLVPVGLTLSIAKGKRLYVFGSLVVNGALKGALVQRSGAGSVNILGSAQMAKGRSVQLAAQVDPSVPGGQADQAVSWSSDSPRLLSVSDKGIVTATALSKPGDTVNITCHVLDGTGVEGTLKITVTEPVSKIVILQNGVSVTRLSATRGAEPMTLDVHIEPETASKVVRWTSSNPAVVFVDKDTGMMRFLKKGTVTISCAATDGTNVKALVKLTVK